MSDRPIDPRLLRYARAATVYVLATAALGAATAGLVIAQAFVLTDAIVSVSLTGLPVLAAVLVGRALLVWAQDVLSRRSAAAVKSDLRKRLLRKTLELGPGWLVAERRAHLTTLATTGLDALDGYFARYLPQLVLASVVPLSVVVVLFGVDPVAAVTVGATLPLIPLFMALVGLATQAHTRRRWRALSVLAHHFADVVAGLPTLKLFGRAKAQAAEVRRVSDSYRRESLATLRIAFLSSLVLELLATLSVALVAVGIGVRLVDGELDLRTGLLALVLAPEAYLPLRLVGAHYHASADGVAAAQQALDVLDTPTPADVVERRGAGLTVEELELRYADHLVLKGLSFEVRPGEIVALTGPSGSGKTSTVAAVLGFVRPAAGRITVDEVAWVPQRPYLFAGTIADNVRLGNPSASDAQVRDALMAAAADELTPDRVIGERGTGVSEGERRRIALARALLLDRTVLLLDEPTAGLDLATERSIATALRAQRLAGKAILLVTHRPELSTVADRRVEIGARDPVPV